MKISPGLYFHTIKSFLSSKIGQLSPFVIVQIIVFPSIGRVHFAFNSSGLTSFNVNVLLSVISLYAIEFLIIKVYMLLSQWPLYISPPSIVNVSNSLNPFK